MAKRQIGKYSIHDLRAGLKSYAKTPRLEFWYLLGTDSSGRMSYREIESTSLHRTDRVSLANLEELLQTRKSCIKNIKPKIHPQCRKYPTSNQRRNGSANEEYPRTVESAASKEKMAGATEPRSRYPRAFSFLT
jgi:hypothetical protein